MRTMLRRGRKPDRLNVRQHLEKVNEFLTCYCWGNEEAIPLLATNEAILRKHDISRASGGRSNIYVHVKDKQTNKGRGK